MSWVAQAEQDLQKEEGSIIYLRNRISQLKRQIEIVRSPPFKISDFINPNVPERVVQPNNPNMKTIYGIS